MALHFADHPQERFRHAPLSSVLCQLRFKNPIFALATDVGVTGFQEAVRRHYPNTQAESGTQLGLTPQGVNVQQTVPTWRFSSESGDWRVGLGVDFVSLETPNYTHFDDFYERLDGILAVLDRTVHPGASARIGLRKVNEIKRPVAAPHEWTRYIRSELLGALAVDSFPTGVKFAFAELRFEDGDNELAIRHGLHPVEAGTYVLDMDYSTETEQEIAATPELRDLFRHFSAGMTSFFYYVAEPELIREMDAYPKEGGA